MKLNLITSVLCLVVLTSCSAESVYNSVQLNNLRRCEQIPIPMQEDCKAQYRVSFEEYERDLEELLENDQ